MHLFHCGKIGVSPVKESIYKIYCKLLIMRLAPLVGAAALYVATLFAPSNADAQSNPLIPHTNPHRSIPIRSAIHDLPILDSLYLLLFP